jgi:three-Cys-motif partner protein
MNARDCSKNNCKKGEGNCSVSAEDGLQVQCVGAWAEDKYFFLEAYLNASCEARRKFADKNNAVFIDLFAGPGRCIIRGEKKEILSGGMRALQRDEAPFNELFFFDISKANTEALSKRVNNKSHCHVMCGDSNTLVPNLVSSLLQKYYRYHFAFIDPFGPDNLKFDTLKELARLERMDMLIHFPIGAIKRNLPNWKKKTNTILVEFLGTDIWRSKITGIPSNQIFKILIDVFKEQLKIIGYPEKGLKLVSSEKDIYAGLPTVSVKNTKDVDLYVLILASKHPLAQKIWTSIIKMNPSGQKTFF